MQVISFLKSNFLKSHVQDYQSLKTEERESFHDPSKMISNKDICT